MLSSLAIERYLAASVPWTDLPTPMLNAQCSQISVLNAVQICHTKQTALPVPAVQYSYSGNKYFNLSFAPSRTPALSVLIPNLLCPS
jgi:hypothetical protein